MRNLLLTFLFCLGVVAFVAYAETPEVPTRAERMERSPQYKDGVFVNPIVTRTAMQDGGTSEQLKTLGEFMRDDAAREPKEAQPITTLSKSDFDNPPADDIRVTWMGHATVLIEIEGKRVLADPIWSRRAGPSSLVGPSRFHEAPIKIDALPPVDVVIISHDHYDHLDKKTILELAELQPDLRFAVPLGVGGRLEAWGLPVSRLIELDWWESAKVVDGLEVVCTPARHFSGRSIGDRDTTLWASWAILGKKKRAYFGGDTGMFDGFADIGDTYGPFDLTLMPIGAYNDKWAAIHINPEEALQAHAMLKGKRLLPIHWATFNLALHPWQEPIERLLANAGDVELLLPQVGQQVVLGEKQPEAWATWWRDAQEDPAQ